MLGRMPTVANRFDVCQQPSAMTLPALIDTSIGVCHQVVDPGVLAQVRQCLQHQHHRVQDSWHLQGQAQGSANSCA